MENKFKKLIEIMETLRSKNGCPWDRKQTHKSIKNDLIEEAYEVSETIDEGSPSKLKEELGDLLHQVIFHSQIASENKNFNIYDVIDSINNKMIRRHPHVFADKKINNEKEILSNWETIKQKEDSHKTRKLLTDGIPKSLPALIKTVKIQKKAERLGRSPQPKEKLLKSIENTVKSLKSSNTKSHEEISQNIGKILFDIVNLSRIKKICPEDALNKYCLKIFKQ